MKNKCFFHNAGIEPDYKDVENLKKFISFYRMNIQSREKTRLCARCQRKLTKAIKHARYLGMLPYVVHHNLGF